MNKKTGAAAFFIILLAIIAIGVGIVNKDNIGNEDIISVFLMIIGAAGLAVSISAVISAKRLRERCTLAVFAECVDVSRSGDSEGRPVYAPKWHYVVNGEEFTVQENVYTSSTFNIGERKEIFVDPDEPRVICNPSLSRSVAPTVIGAACMITFVIGLVLFLK